MSRHVRDAVREFLDLCRNHVSVDCARDIQRLTPALDELALARHRCPHAELDGDGLEAPTRSSGEIRDEIAPRFPNFGLYNIASPVARDVGGGEVLIGDAIDDLVDIVWELEGVAWLFEHSTRDDAERRFAWSFDSHWGRHLRDLQLYLHDRRDGD